MNNTTKQKLKKKLEKKLNRPATANELGNMTTDTNLVNEVILDEIELIHSEIALIKKKPDII